MSTTSGPPREPRNLFNGRVVTTCCTSHQCTLYHHWTLIIYSFSNSAFLWLLFIDYVISYWMTSRHIETQQWFHYHTWRLEMFKWWLHMCCAHIAMSQKTNNQTANLKSSDKGLTTKLPKVILNNLQFCLLWLVGFSISSLSNGERGKNWFL